MENKQSSNLHRFFLHGLFYVVLLAVGFLFGRAYASRPIGQVANTSSTIENIFNIDRTVSHAKGVDFNQFWEVWDQIKVKYVKQPVKDTDLFYGALQGLTLSLGDPYSTYFPPTAAEEFNKSLSGEFSGIGAEIGVKNDQLVVIAPLPGTPAEKAGLRAGDKILMIDKVNTTGMDASTAVDKIRGKAGTTVVLTVSSDGLAKSKEVGIVREKIDVPSVLSSVKSDGVMYARIMQFNEKTEPEFNSIIKKMQKNNYGKMILDLRNNPGGYLDSAITMASEWVKSGVIVSEKTSDGVKKDHTSIGDHRLVGIKTVVLINGGSASASEIVAGALQDTKTATIIGEKSFGKGSVQDYQMLADGSALKLTIAEWLTPNGKNINEQGIAPDIEVKEDFSTEAVGTDVMVDKALEILK